MSLNRSVLSLNPACTSDPDYSRLIQLRTIGSNPNNPITPVTSLVGRLTGRNIVFTESRTYEDYKMRRKVGVLEYNTTIHIDGQVKTKKQQFSHFAKVKGVSQYSQSRLKINAAQSCEDIPVLLPPTNSGIRDTTFPGYILNKSIPFSLYL
jgi:hypothetical protein